MTIATFEIEISEFNIVMKNRDNFIGILNLG